MRFSFGWLREWVDAGLSPPQLGHQLTMAGLELDALEPAAPAFAGVVVARVDAVGPHPYADKLKVCRVDDGNGLLQVVCGAPNVHEGMVAPLARVGAQLPGDVAVEAAPLRGVESAGMLCSARELGLGEAQEGLMALPSDAPLGRSLWDYLALDDSVLEIDLTPNRADCLSIAGIAREVSALTGASLHSPEVAPLAPQHDSQLPITVDSPGGCPRYAGRVIRAIDPQAETPVWMQERLRRSGIRSVAAVVDVTNYVMLELGQPLHAFDLDRLEGGIQVRQARADEPLTLLDGRTVALDPHVLVIADDAGAQAMAGIMGGQASAVGPDTRDVFLESAFFTPSSVAGRARRFGLHTDSSHRFERGVDPELQVIALERATELLLSIVGGDPGPVTRTEDPGQLPARAIITLRSERVRALLGTEVAAGEVERILTSLGCEVWPGDDGWIVRPPAFRFDLAIEADLIEEIARVHGYEAIPSSAQAFTPAMRWRPEGMLGLERLRAALVDRGYHEAITFSFVDRETDRLLMPDQEPLALSNPLSADLSVMRTTLWSGLVKALRHNINRQQARVRLFETGLRFVLREDGLAQETMFAGVAAGEVYPEQWGLPSRGVDFFDVKGDVEALLDLVPRGEAVRFRQGEHPALHPGQRAAIDLGDRQLGWLGALHPTIAGALDLEGPIFLFELDAAMLRRGSLPHYRPLSRFPAIRRDLSLLVDEDVSAEAMAAAIRAAGAAHLREFHIFDVYSGQGIPTGRKSVALGLILQDLSRTLTDDEVDGSVRRIVSQLEQQLGASLRV